MVVRAKITLLASSIKSWYSKMEDINDVIRSLEGIRSIYKERTDSLLDDVQELYMGPRGLGRCEERFLELSLMEERLTRLLLQYKDLLPKDVAGRAVYPVEEDAEITAEIFVYTKDNVNRLLIDVDLQLHNLRKGFI